MAVCSMDLALIVCCIHAALYGCGFGFEHPKYNQPSFGVKDGSLLSDLTGSRFTHNSNEIRGDIQSGEGGNQADTGMTLHLKAFLAFQYPRRGTYRTYLEESFTSRIELSTLGSTPEGVASDLQPDKRRRPYKKTQTGISVPITVNEYLSVGLIGEKRQHFRGRIKTRRRATQLANNIGHQGIHAGIYLAGKLPVGLPVGRPERHYRGRVTRRRRETQSANSLSISPYQSAESSESEFSNSSGHFQNEIQPPMDLNLRIESESIRRCRDDRTDGQADDRTPETERNEATVSHIFDDIYRRGTDPRDGIWGLIRQEEPPAELSQTRSPWFGRSIILPRTSSIPSNCLSQVGTSHTVQNQWYQTCGNLLSDMVSSDNVTQVTTQAQTHNSEPLLSANAVQLTSSMPAEDLGSRLGSPVQENPRVELREIRENQSRSLGISNDLCINALSISPYQSAENAESDSSNSSGQCQHEMQSPMDLKLRIERESIRNGRNDITANDSTPEMGRSEASAGMLRPVRQEEPHADLSQILSSTWSGRTTSMPLSGACCIPSSCLEGDN